MNDDRIAICQRLLQASGGSASGLSEAKGSFNPHYFPDPFENIAVNVNNQPEIPKEEQRLVTLFKALE